MELPALSTTATSSTPAAAAAAAAKVFAAYDAAPAPKPAPYVFELGLVMAGAISAGAYTAGVINFLFEALDNWYDSSLQQALRSGLTEPELLPEEPLHHVRLKTMAGASAGGMCAALTAIAAVEGNTSNFYQAWVQDIDIAPLLDPADLIRQPKRLKEWRSVLNCDILDHIAQNRLARPAQSHWPKWMLSDHLDFFLTLTNLNGLTYEVSQTGGAPQRFTDHADRIQFRLLAPTRKPLAPGAPGFDPALFELPSAGGAAGSTAWDQLAQAALSTGAFPIALLSRIMRFSNPYYDSRWYGNARPTYVVRSGVPDVETYPTGADYLFVDGGLTNNEPLELARRALTDDPSGLLRNDPNGATARRALLMIDPFPSEAKDADYAILKQELGPLAARLFTVLLNQSRFRAEDLLGALDLDVHSRFVVAPARDIEAPTTTTSPPMLACALLQAFGGFLHQGFREHDYELGRRNCQRFLQQWFTLPSENSLFDRWPQELKRQLEVQDEQGQPTGRLPILPLLGKSARQVEAPDWDKARMSQQDYKRLEGQVRQRLDIITKQLSSEIPDGWWAAKAVYPWFVRGKLRELLQEKVMTIIKKELVAAQLLAEK
jgi:predicted acylesterase/phospholipase RssA